MTSGLEAHRPTTTMMNKLTLLALGLIIYSQNLQAQWTTSSDGSMQETAQDVSIADGNVVIKNVGANRGSIDLFDQDDREYLRLYSSGGHGYVRMAGSNPRGIRFFPGNAERVFFAPGGRVGIGTISPASLLHVTGDITQTGTSLFIDNADKINFVRNATWEGSSWQLMNADEAEMLQMRDGGYNFYSAAAGDEGSNFTWKSLMAIKANGNVGIGSAAPKKRLVVSTGDQDGIRIAAQGIPRLELDGWDGDELKSNWVLYSRPSNGEFGIWDDNQKRPRLNIDSLGNIGIGTTEPQARLEVIHTGTLDGKFDLSKSYLTVSNGTNHLVVDHNEIYSDNSLHFGTSFEQDFLFKNVNGSGSDAQMIIKANGNVGIGTTNPVGKLHISHTGTIGGLWRPQNAFLQLSDGTTSMIFDSNEITSDNLLYLGAKDGFQFRSVDGLSGTDLLVIKPDGNVGIGTTDPKSQTISQW